MAHFLKAEIEGGQNDGSVIAEVFPVQLGQVISSLGALAPEY